MKNILLATVIGGTAALASPVFSDDIAAAAEQGKAKYVLCGACHGMDGKGMEPAPGMKMAPSFLDSKLLTMSPEISALILFKGIKKEDPAAYMGQLMMPLGATMSDEDVANLIVYVRKEFAGVEEMVTAEEVAEWRAEYADAAQPTRAELEAMGAVKETEIVPQ